MEVEMEDEASMAVDGAARRDRGKARATDEAVPTVPDSLPWVEKYRPATLDDLISHKDIVSTVTRFIDEKKLPHLLFYGPPGTGKTSTILACARRLYGSNVQSMVLELNASDDRGIDVVRDQIKEFASTRTIFSSGYKLIILDEADAMTNPAQAALRRIIEKYTKNARFCLICNYVSKIIPALQSRCTRFRFSPLEPDQIRLRLGTVIAAERVNIDDGGMQALLKLSRGDMRRALNILQSCTSAFDVVTSDNVHATTGAPLPTDVEDMVKWLLNEPFATAFHRTLKLKTAKGLAMADLLLEIHTYVMLLELPASSRMFLLDGLATIEVNLASGCSEKLQLGYLVGIFREMVDTLPPVADA